MNEFLNELTTFIVYTVWFFIWFYMGTLIYRIYKSRKQQSTKDIVVRYIPILKTEIHGDIIYAYKLEDDSFVCQGKTLEELAELAHKHKNLSLALVKTNQGNYWFINGKTTPVDAKVL